jgi:hypothetical protein
LSRIGGEPAPADIASAGSGAIFVVTFDEYDALVDY